MRIAGLVLLVLAGLYVAACSILAIFQRSFLYYPQPAVPAGDATTETLPVPGEKILVTVRERPGPGAVIFFGGNADAVALLLPTLALAYPDRAIFLMNYRGYGGSSGRPTEDALQSDGLLLFDTVHKRHPEVIVVGRSLGTGIAIRIAAERPARSLVLITPYDSILGVAQHHFPMFPVRWLLLDRYESGRHAPQVRVPTLVLAADHDLVVPRASTQALLARFAPGVATYSVIRNTDHLTIMESGECVNAMREAPPAISPP